MSEEWQSHIWVPLLLHPTRTALPTGMDYIEAPFDLAITYGDYEGGRAFVVYWWANSFDPCEGLYLLQAAIPGMTVKGLHLAKGDRFPLLAGSPDPVGVSHCN